VYHAKGLPVQIIAETLEWRRICDPDGGPVWIKRTLVGGRRTVETLRGAPTPLRRKPADDASIIGLVNPRSLADLVRCRGGWCKINVEGDSGWVAASRIWGVDPAPQCR
jgi:SH3-like domain-containing protein